MVANVTSNVNKLEAADISAVSVILQLIRAGAIASDEVIVCMESCYRQPKKFNLE